MALKVEAGNKAGDTWTDITSSVALWNGMRVGGNAHLGEIGTGSGFDLDDHDAEHSLPVWRVLRVRETATSPNTILLRGRIAEKGVARGILPVGDARAFDVQMDDHNADLRGIPIRKWARPEETDYKRVIALWKDFLKGSASRKKPRRASTRLHIKYRMGAIAGNGSVRNANRVTLPKQVYRDTDPFGILRDIAEAAGKEFFVTTDSELFYDLPTSQKYPASLVITDQDPDESADEYPPNDDVAGDQDGSEFLSGVTLLYGKDKRLSLVRSSAETSHDLYREIIHEDATSLADARKRGKALLSRQAKEDRTYTVAVDLPASKVDLVKYGQTVSFRSAAAGVLSPVVLRVGRLLWEPIAPRRYRAHMELGFPKKLAPRIPRHKRPGGGGGGGSGSGGNNPGNPTPPTGPEVIPVNATQLLYLDDFTRSRVVATATSETSGTSHVIPLPDGSHVKSRVLVLTIIFDDTSAGGNAVNTQLVALGTQSMAGFTADGQNILMHARFIDGTEGWDASGATITLTTATACTMRSYSELLASGEDETGDFAVSGDPPSVNPSWAEADDARWYTAVVAATSASGDPTGYTNLAGGTVGSLAYRISAKDDDSATEDPSTYTVAGTAYALTGAVHIPTSLATLPLQDDTGAWWPGGNPWFESVTTPALFDDYGVSGGVFFFESSTADANFSFGVAIADGKLPMEAESWELLIRYRLTTAAIPADPGERYLAFSWAGTDTLILYFGDSATVLSDEGIALTGEGDLVKLDKALGVGQWNLVRWQYDGIESRARVWAETDDEPTTWDVEQTVDSAPDPDTWGFRMYGRLGNDGGTAQLVEVDHIGIIGPDGSQVGYAGEVYGAVLTPAAS